MCSCQRFPVLLQQPYPASPIGQRPLGFSSLRPPDSQSLRATIQHLFTLQGVECQAEMSLTMNLSSSRFSAPCLRFFPRAAQGAQPAVSRPARGVDFDALSRQTSVKRLAKWRFEVLKPLVPSKPWRRWMLQPFHRKPCFRVSTSMAGVCVWRCKRGSNVSRASCPCRDCLPPHSEQSWPRVDESGFVLWRKNRRLLLAIRPHTGKMPVIRLGR